MKKETVINVSAAIAMISASFQIWPTAFCFGLIAILIRLHQIFHFIEGLVNILVAAWKEKK